LRRIGNTPFAREVVTYRPSYQPTTRGDPKYDTPDAERRGPFTIGVAVETRLPPGRYQEAYAGLKGLSGLPAGGGGGIRAAGLTAGVPAAGAGGEWPVGWLEPGSGEPGPDTAGRAAVRRAVSGHGGLFVGADLEPAQEQLLLQTCNWLLGREERMPADPEE